MDILLSCDPANIHYLSGYDGWSFYVPQTLVLPLDESESPIWVGRAQDANAARATTFLEPSHIVGYPDEFIQSLHRHPFDFIADVLLTRGWGGTVVGIEMDSYYFTARAYEALVRKLPMARFQDAYALVNWVRSIKSPRELDYMRQAGQIVKRSMARAIEMIEPDVRQCDAVAEIYHAQISGTAAYGGDYTAIAPLLPTGLGTTTPHLTWTDEPFVRGEPTVIELAGCRLRYHCPLARTVFLGRPPQRLADASRYVVDGIEAALEQVRPGALCQDLEAAWRQAIESSGLVKDSRIGYSCGLSYPPDWGEHTMSLRPGDLTPLEPNMTLHLIPGVWMEDWGVELSETFRVTESGVELLTDFSRELVVKE